MDNLARTLPEVEDKLPISIEESNRFMEQFFSYEPTMTDMLELQAFMMQNPDQFSTSFKPEHAFAEGVYARELTIPAGQLAFGKRHAKSQLTFLMTGKLTIVNDEGINVVEAPAYWTDPAGTKRAVYAHADSTIVTVHGTQLTNLDDLERELIIKELPFMGGNV